MTIRFGDKVRLASRDRRRLQKITLRNPGEIDSFEALYNFLEWHRSPSALKGHYDPSEVMICSDKERVR